ncbi:MAG: MBL fold metallo-hydrolase [Planctomycetes bacterium]|nr:MBL fold metallo-hydrolase [Planctomycetota bacterium]
MLVTILGSGTAVPVPDRFPAGYLVQAKGQQVLVDCGPGSLRRLAQAGVDLADLDAVLLTHYHTDHCADLGPLLFALRNPRYADRKPLRVLAAPGLERFVRTLTEVWPWLSPRDYELQLQEIGPGRHDLGDLEVTALPIRHTAQSLGYRFDDGIGTAAFSGDADACDELVLLARDTDLFVCDAAFPDEQRVDGHLTPGSAGEHAERAGARTLVLTHFYPECDGTDVVAQAGRRFGGRIVVAHDLLRLPVPGLPGR